MFRSAFIKIFFICLLFGCENEKFFTDEAINYLYEIAYYNEFDNKDINEIYKWGSNLLVHVEGIPNKQDLLLLDECIFEINELGLPVKIKRTNEKNKSNVIVFFDTREKLKVLFKSSVEYNGVAETKINKNNTIVSGRIGIVVDNKINIFPDKKTVILEELYQLMGSFHDSYTYPESVCYNSKKILTSLSNVDKETLKLLYSKYIPTGLTKKEFEIKFGHHLFQMNADLKLAKHLISKDYDKNTYGFIYKFSFENNKIYKHPVRIPVYFINSLNPRDSILYENIVNCFNGISKNLELYLPDEQQYSSFPNDPYPFSGIYLKFNLITNKEKIKYEIKRRTGHSKGSMVIRSDIEFFLEREFINSEKINSLICHAIFKALCAYNLDVFEKGWCKIDESKNIKIVDKKYIDVLKIIYDNNYINYVDKSKFKEICDSIKPIDRIE